MIPEYLVVHHSLTDDGPTVSWGAIRRYHTQERGWTDIGYHFGVELIEDWYEVLLGRWWDQEGAHAREGGMNRKSLGILAVGNFDLVAPTPPLMSKLVELLRHLQRRWGIPRARVLGHREVGLLAGFDWLAGQYKSCPGAQWDMEALRGQLIDP